MPTGADSLLNTQYCLPSYLDVVTVILLYLRVELWYVFTW